MTDPTRLHAIDYDAIDFFRGDELVADPYPYFDWLRAQCPVQREPHHDVMMVTGYEEAIAVYNDTATFSSCNSPTGPFPGFPVPLEGDDVSALIEQYRDQLPMSDQLLTFDPPIHTAHRALLMRLITPKRLRENEEFMWRLADRQIDEFIDATATGEFIRGYGQPFAMLVVADLLGVPESDHDLFRDRLGAGPRDETGAVGSTGDRGARAQSARVPLRAVHRVRRGPPPRSARRRDDRHGDRDVSRRLDPRGHRRRAHRRQPLRGRPGDDACASSAPRCSASATTQALQQLLRDHRELIPNFVEECLRIESPVKGDFRLARVTTELGGVEIPAGTTRHGRERRRQPRSRAASSDPDDFQVERANARQHLAFGHGAHTCPGAPLARGRGPHHHRATARPDRPTSGSPRRSTARPAPAATSTCRRTSCAASAASTSSSNRARPRS